MVDSRIVVERRPSGVAHPTIGPFPHLHLNLYLQPSFEVFVKNCLDSTVLHASLMPLLSSILQSACPFEQTTIYFQRFVPSSIHPITGVNFKLQAVSTLREGETTRPRLKDPSWKGVKTQLNPPPRKKYCSLIVLSIGNTVIIRGEDPPFPLLKEFVRDCRY